MTGRAAPLPVLQSKAIMLQLIKWEMNVREFGPVKPTTFITGRVLLAVLVPCAGNIEV